MCFSDESILKAYLLPDLTFFTSTKEFSAVPIPRTFDVTLHDKKPRTLGHGSEYL